MTILRSIMAVGAIGGLAAACAAGSVQPPVLTYANQGCAAAADLMTAVSLTPPRERAVHVVAVPVDTSTPCLNRSGPTPYVVYQLPADLGDKTVTVGSMLEATRIFAPEVAVLDGRGMVTRTFAREEYHYRGGHYSVQFRPRDEEAYVLVSADPALVGQRYDSIMIGTTTTSVYTGGGGVSWTSGVDNSQSRTFSYEGTVQVLVNDTDTEEGR